MRTRQRPSISKAPSARGRAASAESSPSKQITGLVLSGGGVRGAYEVGVLSGIVEALGLGRRDPCPFQVLAGSSVGAIHAAFVAANANQGDLSLERLEESWRRLRVQQHLRPRPMGFFRSDKKGRSLLDDGPLEELIRQSIQFDQIHRNVKAGRVRALMVAALHISSGKTAVFAEIAPGAQYKPSKDPRRRPIRTSIEAEHILASTALPLLFRPRRVENGYYCDGGLRFNTPIAPAIRAGAERLVVIAPLEPFQAAAAPKAMRPSVPPYKLDGNPTPLFLLGKLLDVLLLDPILYDLEMLNRYNQLVDALETYVPREALSQVEKVMVATRGVPYRKVRTLVFTPSVDIAKIAAKHIRALARSNRIVRLLHAVMSEARGWKGETDWASYLLFDGEYAGSLIELGRADARARAREIRRFFGQREPPRIA